MKTVDIFLVCALVVETAIAAVWVYLAVTEIAKVLL
jgi:hypothetical protein